MLYSLCIKGINNISQRQKIVTIISEVWSLNPCCDETYPLSYLRPDAATEASRRTMEYRDSVQSSNTPSSFSLPCLPGWFNCNRQPNRFKNQSHFRSKIVNFYPELVEGHQSIFLNRLVFNINQKSLALRFKMIKIEN